jgi:hypothetical protein
MLAAPSLYYIIFMDKNEHFSSFYEKAILEQQEQRPPVDLKERGC